MNQLDRRTFPRIRHEAKIMYAPADSDAYRESRMYDFSQGGMYFEGMEALPPFSDVQIRMKEYTPGGYGPEAFRWYLANIRWRRELNGNGAFRYGFGVRFVKKSHAAMGMDAPMGAQPCDLCGELGPPPQIRIHSDSTTFCGSCDKHLGALPDGFLKDCIHRFVAGNVV